MKLLKGEVLVPEILTGGQVYREEVDGVIYELVHTPGDPHGHLCRVEEGGLMTEIAPKSVVDRYISAREKYIG